MAWIHLRGVGPGRVVSDVLAVLKVTAFVLFIAIGFSFGQGSAANLVQTAPVSPANWLLALIPVMFTYSGWNAAAYVAEEVRDPGRNVPLALALGTGAVIVIYLLLNALYLYVLPANELAQVQGIGARRDRRPAARQRGRQRDGRGLDHQPAGEHQRDDLCRAARLLRDGARRRCSSGAPPRVHPRYRTPAAAIIAQAAWASLLVLFGDSRRAAQLHGLRDHPVLGSGGGRAVRAAREAAGRGASRSGAGAIRWRRRIYAIASVAILINGLYRAPGPTGAGALIIAGGHSALLLVQDDAEPEPAAGSGQPAVHWMRDVVRNATSSVPRRCLLQLPAAGCRLLTVADAGRRDT